MSEPMQPDDAATSRPTPPPAPQPGVAPTPPAATPYAAPAAPGSVPPPGYQPPPYPQGYAPAPPAAYGAPYGYPGGGYAPVRTNPLAITSMVSSIVGFALSWTWVLALGLIVGVITGHIALSQISRTKEKGRGMALAGVIVGWVGIGLGLLFAIIIGLFLSTVPSSYGTFGP